MAEHDWMELVTSLVGVDQWSFDRVMEHYVAEVHDVPWDAVCITWRVDETTLELDAGDLTLTVHLDGHDHLLEEMVGLLTAVEAYHDARSAGLNAVRRG